MSFDGDSFGCLAPFVKPILTPRLTNSPDKVESEKFEFTNIPRIQSSCASGGNWSIITTKKSDLSLK